MLLLLGLGAYFDFTGLSTLQAAFGALLGLAIVLFLYNMGRTLWPSSKAP